MLILTRHRDEEILIFVPSRESPEGPSQVAIKVVDIRGDKVRLGFTAPPEVKIHRREVHERILAEQKEGAQEAALQEARKDYEASWKDRRDEMEAPPIAETVHRLLRGGRHGIRLPRGSMDRRIVARLTRRIKY